MLDASREEQLRAALRKSAHIIQELKADLGAYHEPIAVIGMACRFPGGVETPEQYWQLLAQGIDAIGALPPHRIHPVIQQQQASQRGSTTPAPGLQGGFLAAVDHFDAPFFGISPREALVMDPQQRLLLEVTWEALESAHLIPAQLAESETGVFVGIFNDDYSQILYANEAIDQENMFYAMTGNYRSVAAGRIAYTFGLVGPAVAVDTACSSSLVAIHQACQSLRNHECTMALAGGSHLILYEQWATRPTKATDAMFAANGRCKTFDAAADGFGRGKAVAWWF